MHLTTIPFKITGFAMFSGFLLFDCTNGNFDTCEEEDAQTRYFNGPQSVFVLILRGRGLGFVVSCGGE